MKLHFYLRYYTKFGQTLSLHLGEEKQEVPMEYLNDEFWHAVVDLGKTPPLTLSYRYHFHDETGGPGGTPQDKIEWDADRIIHLHEINAQTVQLMDYWNPAGAFENAFFTQPFQDILIKNGAPAAKAPNAKTTHIFRVKAPLLHEDESICLLGHGIALRHWDTAAPILLSKSGNWWTVSLDLSKEDFPLGYKYGIWNRRTNTFQSFESGTSNRTLYDGSGDKKLTILHDGFARFPNNTWRGAGTAIPVFSLRTENSFGVGEFTDMKVLVDWAKSVGLKLIQLLPINDTTATHTWTDSYPYAAVSAFALHPIYLNIGQLAGKKNAAIYKPFAKKQPLLNALAVVDYEAVLQNKWEAIHLLYAAQKAEWSKDAAYHQYLAENKHWLLPYAAFCYLRDKNNTPDFNQWTSHQVYDAHAIEQLFNPKSKEYDAVAIHLYVQWHLHLQLKAATDYAHANGLVVKGDIPIGIYRFSCDAWTAPDLYNMDAQAGAPPDDFAEKGQNWGFPTYNWERMQRDGFAWWRQRFEQMSLYFDAFRIDHILGFFRIWSIPMDAIEGILGRFVPALPVYGRELYTTGLDYDRLCKPFITDAVLWQIFGEITPFVQQNCLNQRPDGRYDLKPECATQRKVDVWVQGLENENPGEDLSLLRNELFSLITNVLLFEEDNSGKDRFHFRFGIEKTTSFQHLNERAKGILNGLYVDYFYRRQDDFWQIAAMEKLPELKRSTNMLICGEDLGMVPNCVPDVMEELGVLSLEIQRMPKKAGDTFFHPKDAPYLSVVTPSTHDMSTIRGWWEEDPQLSQRFYHEMIGYQGQAPYFCEPWINYAIIAQHFNSPAMWAIFQIQDLLGMDGAIRRENPDDERINVPANPKHYWRYRMHLTLEALMQAEGFNKTVRDLVKGSGRG